MLPKQEKRYRRHKRVRSKVGGTAKAPRLCVFRANKHIYAQLIDDEKGKTLASASDLKLNVKGDKKAVAADIGREIAKRAQAKKIKKVVFDRAGYKYHGRIKAAAEGARQAGLKF